MSLSNSYMTTGLCSWCEAFVEPDEPHKVRDDRLFHTPCHEEFLWEQEEEQEDEYPYEHDVWMLEEHERSLEDDEPWEF